MQGTAIYLVRATLRFRPAMEGVPAERSWTVGYYRVADAPAPPLPERFDCERTQQQQQ